MFRLLVFIVFITSVVAQSYAGIYNYAKGFRVSDSKDKSRFVVDLSAKPKYKIFKLDKSPRVVIDLNNGIWNDSLPPHDGSDYIKSVRYSKGSAPLRIVLDVEKKPTEIKNFIIPPSKANKNYRLVVDIFHNTGFKPALKNESFPKIVSIKKIPIPVRRPVYKPKIIIDAGHGGHDPGAIGLSKTREKDITISYSKELAKQLRKTGRYEVYLTRKSDKYLKLGERVNKARKISGDIFISMHADAHINPNIRGLSIYTLSEKASDKEAAALARKENKSDLINGVNLENEADEITALLIDMTQRNTKNISSSFAETIIDVLNDNIKLLSNPHRFAGFRVLTGADIPSVLIELGYLTNKSEEKLLNSNWYKKKLIRNLVEAIDIHFKKYSPNKI